MNLPAAGGSCSCAEVALAGLLYISRLRYRVISLSTLIDRLYPTLRGDVSRSNQGCRVTLNPAG